MERKFYTNDFEHLLKENADQFKMSPSKKVWHGIYNDIHPGTRWPSVAMGLLFVFTLILVGYLNIQKSENGYFPHIQKNISPQKNKNLLAGGQSLTNPLPNKISGGNNSLRNSSSLHHSIPAQTNKATGQNVIEQGTNSFAGSTYNNSDRDNITVDNPLQENPAESMLAISPADNKSSLSNDKIIYQPNAITESGITNSEVTPVYDPYLNTTNIMAIPVKTEFPELTAVEPGKNKVAFQNEYSANNPNKSTSHFRLKKHKNAKISWVYYITPAISYRLYSRQGNIADQNLLGYSNNLTNLNLSKAVTHMASIAGEAGMAMKYSLSKKLKFTSGLQVNYSAYAVQANNIHPIIATLILHDKKTGYPYPFSSISYFGNGPGNVPVNLHNYNVQLSLPVGLEYEFAGNKEVQFSLAGSLQPSFVIANKMYILSTDKRNYLTNEALDRNLNIATNIGTFVSFSSNKLKWQIGPQVYYQLLSSYRNEYQVKEHFIDYGIRVGISRLIK